MAARALLKNQPAAMRSAPVPPRVSSGREAAYRGKRPGMQGSLEDGPSWSGCPTRHVLAVAGLDPGISPDHPACLKRRGIQIGITGTRPVMTWRDFPTRQARED
ncbi:hypothetical protein MicloDRAFT_00042350 [Microvirga lotononidis]|uniref:Uncharacterized protein n=1 Tax=Microvirga lotononidis TaxID=864069 RepID=I4YUM2_9HYPH|nr:hypothetical protein MicloDRAFT_00042350 [Microvirga lotononidis]